MKLFDGTIYIGEFLNDLFHGEGSLTFKPYKKDEKGTIF